MPGKTCVILNRAVTMDPMAQGLRSGPVKDARDVSPKYSNMISGMKISTCNQTHKCKYRYAAEGIIKHTNSVVLERTFSLYRYIQMKRHITIRRWSNELK